MGCEDLVSRSMNAGVGPTRVFVGLLAVIVALTATGCGGSSDKGAGVVDACTGKTRQWFDALSEIADTFADGADPGLRRANSLTQTAEDEYVALDLNKATDECLRSAGQTEVAYIAFKKADLLWQHCDSMPDDSVDVLECMDYEASLRRLWRTGAEVVAHARRGNFRRGPHRDGTEEYRRGFAVGYATGTENGLTRDDVCPQHTLGLAPDASADALAQYRDGCYDGWYTEGGGCPDGMDCSKFDGSAADYPRDPEYATEGPPTVSPSATEHTDPSAPATSSSPSSSTGRGCVTAAEFRSAEVGMPRQQVERLLGAVGVLMMQDDQGPVLDYAACDDPGKVAVLSYMESVSAGQPLVRKQWAYNYD